MVSEPGKVVLDWHTLAVRNFNLNTETPKTDPNGIKTGYYQVDTVVFGKDNELGLSLPPAESPSVN